MPPIHAPLAERSGNIVPRQELSEFERGQIVGMHDGGAKKAEIQQFYSHLYSIVLDTIANNELYNNRHSKSRSGIPKSYLLAKERHML